MSRILHAAVAALALLAAGSVQAAPVKAKLDTGVAVGQSDGGVAIFRSIPFAAPPVGPLRWTPPQPAKPWSGERDAGADSPACLQAVVRFGGLNLAGQHGVSEDCLYLNVFAPPGAKKAPVMVWIHGGANVAGTGSVYDGSAFARDGIVLVAINYRLGALGFFAHPALTREAPAGQPLGSYALMDQIAALQWVRRNAAAFGGDPNNVTVFGESAGAMNIVALLGVPSAKGLFHKAIIESNIGWGTARPLATAETAGVALAQKAGLGADATADQLRGLSGDKVLAAGAGQAGTIVDGRLISESANRAIAGGRAIDVPIVIGSNSFEALLIANRKPPPTPDQLWQFTDGFAGAPARWIARQEAGGAPAWLYYFSYVREDARANSPGAGHASEIPYVFGAPQMFGGAAPSAADSAMAELMHGCWVAFAKTGKPACPSGPVWPAYTAGGDQLMEFGAPSGVREHFRKPQLDPAEAQFSGGNGPL
jgi:para-nitrobenzyl esterase